jgi:hypothetical protein
MPFPSERDTTVPAVSSRHMDLCLVEEHGRILGSAVPTVDSPRGYSAWMLTTRPILPVV